MGGTLQVTVLGLPVVALDGEPLGLRPREASVVAALAVDHAVVPSDVLAERLWDEPPPTARKSIQNHVARIRRMVPGLVETIGGGYALHPGVEVDAWRFATILSAPSEVTTRRAAFTDALEFWRGPPFPSLADHRDVVAARTRLGELRSSAEEHLLALDLLHGAANATAEAERLVVAEPYRERRWWLLILARYRAGQRRGALEGFQEARRTLRDQAGLGLGADLIALDAMVLADDVALLGASLLVDLAGPPPSLLSRVDVDGPVITGREPDLDRLLGITAPDERCTVAVVGEAGIGKTNLGLALRAAHRKRGGDAVWTSGSRTPDGPLAPVISLIEDLMEHGVDPIVAWLVPGRPVREQLNARLRTAPDGSLADPVSDVVADLLVSALPTPPLVIVDDAQWVPPSSARALAAACRGAGCHLVLLARPGPRPAPFEDLDAEVTLLGLSLEAVARHLSGVTTQPLHGDAVAELHRRCGGNPLLLGELIGNLADTGALDGSGTVASLRPGERPSATVADLARQRLSDLAGPARQVVEAASVAGVTFASATIDAVVGTSAPALEEAHVGGIVVPIGQGVWRFRHEVIRDAIYADLNPAVRAELHDAVAASLERTTGSTWDQIVHHRLRAEALDPEATMAACRKAAAEATGQFAHREAAGHLERLGHLLVRYDRAEGAEALDVEISRAEALQYAGDPAAAAALLAAADRAEAQGEPERFGRALLCLCRLGPNTDASAPDPQLADRIDRALTAALSPGIRAELAGAASLLHSMSHDQRRCRQLFEHAVCTARAGAPEVLARVLPFAYLGLGHPRDLDRRTEIAEELYDLTDEDPAGRFSALHLRFSVEVQRGRASFRSTHRCMVALAAEMADPAHRWADAYTRACVAFLDNDLRAAEDAAEASLAQEGIARSRRLAIYGVQLVGLRRADDRLAELDERVRELVASQPDVAGWKAVEFACAASAGDADRAATAFDRLAADGFAGLPDDYSHSAAALLVAEGALRLGDVDRLRAVVPVLEPLAGLLSWTGTTTLGPVDLSLGRILGALGQRGRARKALERAKTTGRRMGAPAMEAEALEALGALG